MLVWIWNGTLETLALFIYLFLEMNKAKIVQVHAKTKSYAPQYLPVSNDGYILVISIFVL